jgi:hypothetical protein
MAANGAGGWEAMARCGWRNCGVVGAGRARLGHAGIERLVQLQKRSPSLRLQARVAAERLPRSQ